MESGPPVMAVWLLRAAAALAPASERADWRALWLSRLENLWILAGRGELPAHASTETARLCRSAIARAFWMRLDRRRVLQWLRGPGFILWGGAASLALLAVLSRGFQGTRGVIYTFIAWRTEPRILRYDPRADLVVRARCPRDP